MKSELERLTRQLASASARPVSDVESDLLAVTDIERSKAYALLAMPSRRIMTSHFDQDEYRKCMDNAYGIAIGLLSLCYQLLEENAPTLNSVVLATASRVGEYVAYSSDAERHSKAQKANHKKYNVKKQQSIEYTLKRFDELCLKYRSSNSIETKTVEAIYEILAVECTCKFGQELTSAAIRQRLARARKQK